MHLNDLISRYQKSDYLCPPPRQGTEHHRHRRRDGFIDHVARLKAVFPNITAVVSVADNGGSSVVAQRSGHHSPGDIRNCIMALTDTEPLMSV